MLERKMGLFQAAIEVEAQGHAKPNPVEGMAMSMHCSFVRIGHDMTRHPQFKLHLTKKALCPQS